MDFIREKYKKLRKKTIEHGKGEKEAEEKLMGKDKKQQQ